MSSLRNGQVARPILGVKGPICHSPVVFPVSNRGRHSDRELGKEVSRHGSLNPHLNKGRTPGKATGKQHSRTGKDIESDADPVVKRDGI